MSTIEQCVMCGCTEVPNQTLTIPVNMLGIISVNVLGAKCANPIAERNITIVKIQK